MVQRVLQRVPVWQTKNPPLLLPVTSGASYPDLSLWVEPQIQTVKVINTFADKVHVKKVLVTKQNTFKFAIYYFLLKI